MGIDWCKCAQFPKPATVFLGETGCGLGFGQVLFVEFDMTITNVAEAWARERIHAGLQAVVLSIFDPRYPKFHIAVS
jgi:hypothetical protein